MKYLGTRERKKRLPNSSSSSNVIIISQTGAPPPIPDPDYSCSESEADSDEEQKQMNKLASRLSSVQLQPVENSGNSNARYAIKKVCHNSIVKFLIAAVVAVEVVRCLIVLV